MLPPNGVGRGGIDSCLWVAYGQPEKVEYECKNQ